LKHRSLSVLCACERLEYVLFVDWKLAFSAPATCGSRVVVTTGLQTEVVRALLTRLSDRGVLHGNLLFLMIIMQVDKTFSIFLTDPSSSISWEMENIYFCVTGKQR
jgi:hypothetical protein